MATPEQIADFIQQRITVGRVRPCAKYWSAFDYPPLPYYGPQLPSVEQIAKELIQDGQFSGLKLGGFLNTPTGEFLERAVELVVPRAFFPEYELLVAALKLAAELQQGKARGNAVLFVGGTLLIGVLLTGRAKAA